MKKANNILDSGALESRINDLYVKSGFINGDMSWAFKILEMLQDQSAEAYDIYQSLNKEQKEDVLIELYEMDNDMGSDGDGTLETSKENLSILLKDAKNGKKYAKGGGVEDGEFYVGQSIMLDDKLPHFRRLTKDIQRLVRPYYNVELVIEEIIPNKPHNFAKAFVRSSGQKVPFEIKLNEKYIEQYAQGGGVEDIEQIKKKIFLNPEREYKYRGSYIIANSTSAKNSLFDVETISGVTEYKSVSLEEAKSFIDEQYDTEYADGGSIEDTGNTNVLKYFSGLNMSALPNNAVQYIQDQILTDSNINLLPTDDEDFVDVKNTIAELYPAAVGVKKQETATETKTEGSEVSEWKEAIETLNMLIEDGGSKKDLDEWNEAVETLNMLIEG